MPEAPYPARPADVAAYREQVAAGARHAEGAALVAERIRQHAGEDASADDLIDRAYRAGYAQALMDNGARA